MCLLSLLKATAKVALVSGFERMFCIAAMSDGLAVVIPFSILAAFLRLFTSSSARAKVAQQALSPVTQEKKRKTLSFAQRSCSIAMFACAILF
jgi:uncharacterized membrane protein